MTDNMTRLFRRENIPAYLAVMAAWICFSAVSSAILKITLAPTVSWLSALLWASMTVMAGMAILFVASALNLRYMREGFERLAQGDQDPKIPPVWCPVLTMAADAAIRLRRSIPVRPESE